MEIKVDQYMIYLYLHTIFGERPIPNIRIKWNLHWSSPPFDKGDAPNFAATRDLLGLDVFSGCCDSFDTSFILFTTSSFSFLGDDSWRCCCCCCCCCTLGLGFFLMFWTVSFEDCFVLEFLLFFWACSGTNAVLFLISIFGGFWGFPCCWLQWLYDAVWLNPGFGGSFWFHFG